MKRFYQKIIYAIMITSFTWVVIGDLVNMHMKLIYKKDLYNNSIVFVKTVKKEKSYKKILIKNINVLSADTYNIKFFPKIICSFLIIKRFDNTTFNHFYLFSLRGPPSYI
jgi:hypothetical protein